jgi:hypothetical protein
VGFRRSFILARLSKPSSLRALEVLNFFIADVQNGMGPYVTLFLKAGQGWNPAQIGLAMAAIWPACWLRPPPGR